MRQKLLSLETEYSEVIQKDKLRYHYYRYVTYAYNRQFNYAWEEINDLRKLPYSPNPDIQQVWLDDSGEPRLFEAKYDQVRKHSVFLPEIQKNFSFRGPRVAEQSFKVILKFLVSGIVAIIIPKSG